MRHNILPPDVSMREKIHDLERLKLENEALKQRVRSLETHNRNLEHILQRLTRTKMYRYWQWYVAIKLAVLRAATSPRDIPKGAKIFFTKGPRVLAHELRTKGPKNAPSSLNSDFAVWVKKHYPSQRTV